VTFSEAQPQVSVIIPSYNSARYLGDAIDSVLNQGFSDLEVLVVDDGSTDGTATVLSRYGGPVRCIRQANSGVANARNRGIEESRGRYVAFLDADDTWLGHKLDVQLAAMRENPSYRACYSAFTVVGPDMKPLRSIHSRRQRTALEDLLHLGNVIGSICTVVCERELFEAAGAFDPSLSQCADWDMWVRLAALTEFLYLDVELATYRQHHANMSRNAALLERDSLRVLDKGFAMTRTIEGARAHRRAAYGRNYMVLAGNYFRAGCYRDFVRCASRAVAMDFRQAGRLIGFPFRQLQPRNLA